MDEMPEFFKEWLEMLSGEQRDAMDEYLSVGDASDAATRLAEIMSVVYP